MRHMLHSSKHGTISVDKGGVVRITTDDSYSGGVYAGSVAHQYTLTDLVNQGIITHEQSISYAKEFSKTVTAIAQSSGVFHD